MLLQAHSISITIIVVVFEDYYTRPARPEGQLKCPPEGAGVPQHSPHIELDHEIILKAGETKLLDATLQTGKRELFAFTALSGG